MLSKLWRTVKRWFKKEKETQLVAETQDNFKESGKVLYNLDEL
jgi:hypothetical protein